MSSVAYGLGWHIVRRHRLGLSVLAAGALGLVTLRHTPGIVDGVLIGCTIWFCFGLLYVAAIFTQPEADITGPGSGYPNHLFVLPVRTRDLVLWPMLFGAAALAIGWLLVAGLVLNRPPHVAPVLWPACMLAAILSALQALFWTPVRFPQARVVIALGLLGGFVYFGSGNPLGWNQGFLAAAFLLVVPVAYAVAVAGVARARRSDEVAHSPSKVSRTRPVRIMPPFASPQRAQFWYEFRRGGLVFPLIVLAVCVVASIPLFFYHGMGFLIPASSISANLYVSVYIVGLIRGVPFIAWILGGAVRISGSRTGALTMPAFIATRPLTSLELLVPRLKARTASALVACGILLLCVLVWFRLPAQVIDLDTQRPLSQAPLLTLLWRALPLRKLAAAGIYLLLIVAITLRNYLVGQFASLSGKPALAYGYMAAAYGSPIMAVSLMAALNYHIPDMAGWFALFAIAVTLKAAASAFVVVQLLRRKLTSTKAIAGAISLWCVAAGCLYAGFLFIHSETGGLDRLIGFSDLHAAAAPGTLFLMAVFWTPFARIAAALLTLDSNRRSAP
ncbi:MAG: hypothetical protein ACYC96_14860 [Fimbriimonadaceae bacterium]